MHPSTPSFSFRVVPSFVKHKDRMFMTKCFAYNMTTYHIPKAKEGLMTDFELLVRHPYPNITANENKLFNIILDLFVGTGSLVMFYCHSQPDWP